MDASTGSPYLFEELDMSDNDDLDSERNIDGDEKTELSCKFF